MFSIVEAILQGISGYIADVTSDNELKTQGRVKGATSNNLVEVNSSNELLTNSRIKGGTSGNLLEINSDNEAKGIVKLTDIDAHLAKISSDGRLLVDTVSVVIPEGATAIQETDFQSVGTTDYNKYYVIPSGTQLVIQILEGCGEFASLGNRVDLYYQPNGNATGEYRITVAIQVNGASYIKTVNWVCPDLGNGTRRIALRFHRNDGTPKRYIGGEWKGYYYTP